MHNRHHLVDSLSGAGSWVIVHFHRESPDLARMPVFALGRQAVVVERSERQEAVLNAAREILAI